MSDGSPFSRSVASKRNLQRATDVGMQSGAPRMALGALETKSPGGREVHVVMAYMLRDMSLTD